MIYLVRHGETTWNLERRRQGRRDSPLTVRGVAQVHAIGRKLRGELTDRSAARIISSRLGRARATASVIADCLAIDQGKIAVAPLLDEQDMGCWEGLTKEEIDKRYPGARRTRRANKWDYLIPGGETFAQVHDRSATWLATIPEDVIVVAVTHMEIGRSIRGAYCQLDPSSIMALTHPFHAIYRLHKGKVQEISCDV